MPQTTPCFEKSMYVIKIFEKFTNLSSTGAKNASHVQRTTIEAIRFVLRTDPKRETSSEGTKRARKRQKNLKPLDLAQRIDSRWINEKVHEL